MKGLDLQPLRSQSSHECLPVTGFFLKHGVAVMTVRELFEFVTDPSVTHENVDAYLAKVRWGQDGTNRQ